MVDITVELVRFLCGYKPALIVPAEQENLVREVLRKFKIKCIKKFRIYFRETVADVFFTVHMKAR